MKTKAIILLTCIWLAGCEAAYLVAGAVQIADDLGDIGNVDFDSTWCRNPDGTLYALVSGKKCPGAWTEVADRSEVPDLRCESPEGDVYRVNAEGCPPEWTEKPSPFDVGSAKQ